MIVDADVTCTIPSSAPPESLVSIAYCTASVSLAQLSHRMWENLSCAASVHQHDDDILAKIAELDQELQTLKSTNHELDQPLEMMTTTTAIRLMSVEQAIDMRYQYYGVLFDLHTALSCPWSYHVRRLGQHPDFKSRADNSCTAVANASREAILLTSHLKMTAATPRL